LGDAEEKKKKKNRKKKKRTSQKGTSTTRGGDTKRAGKHNHKKDGKLEKGAVGGRGLKKVPKPGRNGEKKQETHPASRLLSAKNSA